MFPVQLEPTGIEIFQFDDQRFEIPKAEAYFPKWTGPPIKETFGGKPLVAYDDEPMFAELAIMRTFIDSGWEARWMETYGRSKQDPICLSAWKDDQYKNQEHHPISNQEIILRLKSIAMENGGSFAGCWDVVGWKEEMVLFAEFNRSSRDRIRESQRKWLYAAMQHGLAENNFLVVQWDFK